MSYDLLILLQGETAIIIPIFTISIDYRLIFTGLLIENRRNNDDDRNGQKLWVMIYRFHSREKQQLSFQFSLFQLTIDLFSQVCWLKIEEIMLSDRPH